MLPVRGIARAACALCALALVGCSPGLAGTNDAALVYFADADPSSGAEVTGAALAAGVKARLSSAQIAADVDAIEAGRVRVVVDADAAGSVDALLLWRGGLRAYRLDDALPIAPPETSGLRPLTAPAADGRVERWWQGSAEAVSRAVLETKLDADHVALAERLPSGEWRTRVAISPPLAELGVGPASIASIETTRRGRAVALTFSPGARDPLAAAQSAQPEVRIGIARSRTLLAAMPIDEALATPLVLSFGDDLAAYTRAQHARMLLASPVLPPMRRASVERLPPRWGLAAACALLPFALSFAWLFFVRRFDRARPEPMWLVTATFALGGLAVVPAAIAEIACATSTPWLDPSVMTFGGQAWALPITIVAFTVVVGFSEEGAKFLGAWSLAWHRREFDEPVDGIVYGCAAALGFAAVENVKYFAMGRMSGVVIALRAFMTVPAHMFFGAIWGYAMGQRLVSRKASVPAFLALAALAHGAFDATLSTDGMQLAATLLVLALAVAFVAMLRSALRHGAIPPRMGAFEHAPPPTEPLSGSAPERVYFRVGSPLAFYACAAAMVVCAMSLTVLGAAYEFLHHRIGVVFVSIATALLALFGLAARATAATIPLDIAVDPRGVTFAGACTPWNAIEGLDIASKGTRAFVVLRLKGRSVRLGPTSADGARAIAACLSRPR
jgi:RsiW-degrading membrane proteinase PrsW (M82 family)